MAPDDESADVTEHNFYRDTLTGSKTTVRDCSDAVHSGAGSPLDAVAQLIATGGWVCSEATSWTAEMADQCSGIPEAFDDAVLLIQQKISGEDLRVPEHDWRGKNWPPSWVHRHNY